MSAALNASVEAYVAVLVGPLVTFAPSETLVGLGGGMVGVVGEMGTSE